MSTYTKIKDKRPDMTGCFFAFSDKQIAEGKKKMPEGEKIFYAGLGLYGTKEGLKSFYNFHDAMMKEIAEECDPQDVYDYEFNNHECSYTNDDTEAIKMVVAIFGEDRSAKVKRRFAVIDINDLFKT